MMRFKKGAKMKKTSWAVLFFAMTSFVFGGGDKGGLLSAVAKIQTPVKVCQEAKLYIDYAQNLMWQDQPYTDGEDGGFKQGYSAGKVGTHSDAMRYCRVLNYGGYTDWRLPTADELIQVHAPQHNPFIYHRGADFWSSTPASANKYYVVYTADAMRYERSTSETNYIRCVRCLEK